MLKTAHFPHEGEGVALAEGRDSTALQSSLRKLADAYGRFFRSQTKRPWFKNNRNPVQSCTTKNNHESIAVVEGRVKLPKMGLVRISKSREVRGRSISATITRKPSGKYFVSLLCVVEKEVFLKTGTSVGIDLGITHFAVLSDRTPPLKNLRPFRSLEQKLAKEQRILSRRMVQAKKDGMELHEARNYQNRKRRSGGSMSGSQPSEPTSFNRKRLRSSKTTTTSASRI